MKSLLAPALAAALGLGALAGAPPLSARAPLAKPRQVLAPRPTPLPTQAVPLPQGTGASGFARAAERLPITFGPVLAPAWVVMDADSGRVLAGHNIDKRMFPASTTKTMTALLAVESGRLDSTFTLSARPSQVGEASVYLAPGEKFVLRDLVKAALIRSANDSCVAIAEAVAGSEAKFVARMNARAKALGALHTHFANPHGLHNPQHYTTPRDLALIARRAMSLGDFSQITREREDRIHGNAQIGASRLLLNRNRLLFRWADCDGVKTGYTRQAGHCLIASATRLAADGKPWRLIAVVMKAPDSWSDAYNALVHAGFEKFEPQVLARAGQQFQVPRPGADAQDTQNLVAATLPRTLRVPLAPGESAQQSFGWPPQLAAAAALGKGDSAGRVLWSVGGQVVAQAPLFATAGAPGGQEISAAPGLPAARESIKRGFQSNRALIGLGLLMSAIGLGAAALLLSHRSFRGTPPRAGSSEAPLNKTLDNRGQQ